MATITVSDSHTFDPVANSARHVVVALDNPGLVSALADANVLKAVGLSNEQDLKTLQLVASNLHQACDAASKADCHFSVDDHAHRVSLVMLPSACSRHNTPARSHALAAAVKDVKSNKAMTVVLVVASVEHAFAQACAVGRQFPQFSMKSSDRSDQQVVQIVVHFPEPGDHSVLLARAALTINNIRLAQRLVEMPTNVLHTDAYVQQCRELAAMFGCGVEVIQGKELEERGFGGLWGVGKAAEHLPALVILSYHPAVVEEESSVCLVGKGIVYDTGGLSIKTPTTAMAGMKTDMGGSAAALGAFLTAVADNKLRRPLHCLLCLAENSVGPAATRPDDVHTLLSGRTVEVNNTDAEGRLVLADGVFYAHKFLNAGAIVDIATLTGAQLIATGKKHAAIFCSHDSLETEAIAAGKFTGDLTFPIPFAPEFYRAEFRSVVADMKNSVADRGNAQSSCAGTFIANHLEDYLAAGKQWLHVDMAGPVLAGDRATGYGVALLFDLVCRLNGSH